MDRASEKSTLLAQIESREAKKLSVWQPTEKITEVLYQPFELVGHYQELSFLLDNRIKNGNVGYEVLTPFKLFTGETILVNRGWIKAGKYRQDLPQIEQLGQLVTIQGYFYQPEGDIPVLKELPEEQGWPRRIQQVHWDKLERALGFGFTERAEFRLGRDQQLGAYATGWPKTSILPEKHTGYAYQWFALSIALIILTVMATIKIKRNEQ